MLWSRDWEFCETLDCLEADWFSSLQDGRAARQWLQAHKGNLDRMLAMRSLLSREGTARDISRMSDDAVLDEIANLLVSRRVHVHGKPEYRLIGDGEASQTSTVSPARSSAETLPRFPLSGRGPRVPAPTPRQQVNEPSTFSPNVNHAAQAATLVVAAARGSAACYI